MNEADNQQATLGWLAGIWDTDGTFGIRLGHKQVLTPFASVVNTNEKIVEGVASILKWLEVGHHVSWKSNGSNAKPLGTVQVVGFQRLQSLFAVLQPIIKLPQLETLIDYVGHRMALSRRSPYTETDYQYRVLLRQKTPLEPQRLHVMLSSQTEAFLTGWLAGVVDGDGSIMIRTGSFTTAKTTRLLSPDLVVINSEPVMIEATKWILRMLGSDCTVVHKKQWNGNKIFHAQTSSYKRTIPAIQAIRPYLHGKAQQADLVLELARFRQTVPFHTPYGDYEYGLQAQMKELNRRGDEDIVWSA